MKVSAQSTISRTKQLAKAGLETVSALQPRHWSALRTSLTAHRGCIPPSAANLRAAISWLKRAQDVTGSGGVSWGYRARLPIQSRYALGWQPAYPETSGYIIESLIRYGEQYSDPDAIERARRIADWEISIQLPDGGTQGGPIGATPLSSSTFVTGQVLSGFVHAYQKFGTQSYAQAAERSAKFLLSCLDDGGRFIEGYSYFCAPGAKAYEVRTGWALALYGTVCNDAEGLSAGRRIAEFAVACQQENGWFDQDDLDEHEHPLTHTIGYTLEGLVGTGVLLSEPRYLDAARTTLRYLQKLVRPDGFLAGRWTRDWRPAVDSCCLTGNCQIAFVCFRMHRSFPDDGFVELGDRLLGFVTGTQALDSRNPDKLGAINGSYPFGGEYGRHSSPNWAAKFYVDAIMERTKV